MNDKRFGEIMQDIRAGKEARELENKYGELISKHDLFWTIRLLARRLEKKKDLEDDRKKLYNRIARLYEYIEDGELIENQYLLEELASMQNYCN